MYAHFFKPYNVHPLLQVVQYTTLFLSLTLSIPFNHILYKFLQPSTLLHKLKNDRFVIDPVAMETSDILDPRLHPCSVTIPVLLSCHPLRPTFPPSNIPGL